MKTDLNKLSSPFGVGGHTPDGLVDILDLRRIEIASRIAASPSRQANLGQFLTPAPIARFMAGMLSTNVREHIRMLDPGAGTGILTVAAVAELIGRKKDHKPRSIKVAAWELDAEILPELRKSLQMCENVCREAGVAFKADVYPGNFIIEAALKLGSQDALAPFDVAIMNPPYRKLRSDTTEREHLRAVGIETSNLYAAFVWLALKLLKNGGELVAITPRSFMNGPYFRPARVFAKSVAFDNKLNVLHRNGAGLPEYLAKGLAVFLNSTAIDLYFRQFSGHTQVNACDLCSLRFPNLDALTRLGTHVTDHMLDEDQINWLLEQETPMTSAGDPVAIKRRVQEAIDVLKALKAPRGQRNERSGLTLLGLLDLGPGQGWAEAKRPLRGVTELIKWMSDQYDKTHASNTREAIRRFTLHQFIQMGLVVRNPDNPVRPTNSPHNVYQVEASTLDLLRTYGSEDWSDRLSRYLESMAGQHRLRREARKMELGD